MSGFDYDLFVIGAGSGGVRAARLAANLGLKVGVAEEDRAGGTCVLRGCVPKKFMVYASSIPEQIKYAQGFAWSAHSGPFDWLSFRETLEAELSRLSEIYASNLRKAGVTLINAHARFKDQHTLILTALDGAISHVTAKTVLIAVGGWPFVPRHIHGVAAHAITSNEIFKLEALPHSIAIVGGGYIAVEFAGIMHGLGVKTTLVYRGEKILRGFDEEVRDHLTEELKAKGIDILTHTEPLDINQEGGALRVRLTTGESLSCDQILYASGRKPKTDNLGLEEIGIVCEAHGGICVDAYSKTAIEHIYAIGDVTNRVNLTPVAIREGIAFVETVFKHNPTAYDHETIPTAVFSQPEIGTVGLSEHEAIEKGFEIDVYTTRFRAMKTVFVQGTTRVFMKLIVDRNSDVVLGCHMVGPDSGEIIQMAGIAVKHRLTKAQWDATCAVHPTAAEEFVTLKDKRAV